MKKQIALILFALSSFSLQAELAGEFEKTKGPSECPEGILRIKADQKQRYVIFGTNHSWALSLEDKGGFSESVEKGCTYNVTYEKKENSLTVKTINEKCPNNETNGVQNESLVLENDVLTYNKEFTSVNKKKTSYQCFYKKQK